VQIRPPPSVVIQEYGNECHHEYARFSQLIESTGIPFPGETMLLVASISAGTTHCLSIALVIVAVATGAILGDNLGYWLGREGGHRR
jgi:membrane protein DedA with SNARE-associated domain